MAEIPSSEPNEQEFEQAYVALRRWIEYCKYAAEGICAGTGLVVLINYREGILTPSVDEKNLTAAQRATIQQWQDGCPNLTINFHR